MQKLLDVYKKYYAEPFRRDYAYTMGSLLAGASGIALVALGLAWCVQTNAPPLSDLTIAQGTFVQSKSFGNVDYLIEGPGNVHLAACDWRRCSISNEEGRSFVGRPARMWVKEGVVWQLEVDGKLVRPIESFQRTINRRQDLGSAFLLIGGVLLCLGLLRQLWRYDSSSEQRP